VTNEASFAERVKAVDQADESVDDSGAAEVLPCLPDEFWRARDTLTHIRNAAWSMSRSGDVALFGVMTRVASLVSHNLYFDAGVGRGSLNLYAAVVGRSGAGKSSGVKIAKDLIPVPRPLQHEQEWLPSPYLSIGMGTGEGLIEAYYGEVVMETGDADPKGKPKKEKVRKQVRHNVFCYVDEGAQIIKQMERVGSTAGAIIRTMWGGEAAGQQNAQSASTRYIREDSYSLGLLIGFQQSTALPFLSGAESNMGTPQRFLWGGIYDPALPHPDALPVHPGELKIDLAQPWSPSAALGPRRELRAGAIHFPASVRAQMLIDQGNRTRGMDRDADPLNAHEPLMRCKVAAILAIIDNRFEVNQEDWDLARIVWNTNCAVRDGLIAYAKAQSAAEEDARTAAHISRQIRTQEATQAAEGENHERVGRHIARLVHSSGRATRGEVKRLLRSGDRPAFDQALEVAVDMSWVAIDGDKHLTAGPSVPA
jgi:hypothetical protein